MAVIALIVSATYSSSCSGAAIGTTDAPGTGVAIEAIPAYDVGCFVCANEQNYIP